MTLLEMLTSSQFALYSGVLLATLGIVSTFAARALRKVVDEKGRSSHERLADMLDAGAAGSSIVGLGVVIVVPIAAGWPLEQLQIIFWALIVAVVGLFLLSLLGGLWTSKRGKREGVADVAHEKSTE